jgi:hypothetical protein
MIVPPAIFLDIFLIFYSIMISYITMRTEKQRQYAREYREKHIEHIRERDRKWRAEHKDEVREYHLNWRANNKDKYNAYHKKWYALNADKTKLYSIKQRIKTIGNIPPENIQEAFQVVKTIADRSKMHPLKRQQLRKDIEGMLARGKDWMTIAIRTGLPISKLKQICGVLN